MIVLFDGVCNLCSRVIQFLLPRDERGTMKFASLQSPYARVLLRQYGLAEEENPSSIVLIHQGKAFTESGAALRIFGALRFPWNLLMVLLLIPRFLRDPAYRLIASRRYQWFGKADACWLPSPEWKDRFIE